MEIWKNIENYENKYQISNFGNVKSLNYRGTKKEKLLKLVPNKIGYINVQLSKNGIVKPFYVHRLVAIAFLNNVKGKNEVNHINMIKHDNRVENLEWCSKSENIIHYVNNKIPNNSIGVYFCKKRNNWRTCIQRNNKRVSIGYYSTKEEAISARIQYKKDNNIT